MYGNSLYNFYNSSLELKLLIKCLHIHLHQSLQNCRTIQEILRFISLEFQKGEGSLVKKKIFEEK